MTEPRKGSPDGVDYPAGALCHDVWYRGKFRAGLKHGPNGHLPAITATFFITKHHIQAQMRPFQDDKGYLGAMPNFDQSDGYRYPYELGIAATQLLAAKAMAQDRRHELTLELEQPFPVEGFGFVISPEHRDLDRHYQEQLRRRMGRKGIRSGDETHFEDLHLEDIEREFRLPPEGATPPAFRVYLQAAAQLGLEPRVQATRYSHVFSATLPVGGFDAYRWLKKA